MIIFLPNPKVLKSWFSFNIVVIETFPCTKYTEFKKKRVLAVYVTQLINIFFQFMEIIQLIFYL